MLYFHLYLCKLQERAECHREVFWHTVRHAVYGSQFIIVANLRFHGFALLALALLYAVDVLVAWSDVLEETVSRRSQGGLPSGEYFMHIVLSLLVGCYFVLVAQSVWPDRLLETGVVIDPPAVPLVLRTYMTIMGVAAFSAFFYDLRKWIVFGRTPAAVAIAAGKAQVW